MSFYIVIPARMASSRLPNKALLDIAGKPMVVRVLERMGNCAATATYVATDHPEIAAAVVAAGGQALMTRADHPSGTDRLAEVVAQLGLPDDAVIVNVQGDEPLIDPELVQAVAEDLVNDPLASIATVGHPIHRMDEVFNPNVVKLVCDHQGYALYFSRAPIPWARDAYAAGQPAQMPAGLPVYRHVGLYAYRAGFLRRYVQTPQADIEQFEALEQLRALWAGEKIRVRLIDQAPPAGVDTQEDLERVRRMFDHNS